MGVTKRQQKLAVSLAIVGAIAAPFVFGTWKLRPMSKVWVPLTAEEKASVAAYLKETKDCQLLRDRVDALQLQKLDPQARTGALLRNNDFLEEGDCHLKLDRLNSSGQFETRLDPWKYLAFNAAAIAASFSIIYSLALLLPALARRYWRWLNT